MGSNSFKALVVLPIAAPVGPLPIPHGGLLDMAISIMFAAIIIIVFSCGTVHKKRKVGAALPVGYPACMAMRATSQNE